MQAVYVVAPDEGIRDALKTFLESFNVPVEVFADAYQFLDSIEGSTGGGIDGRADDCSGGGTDDGIDDSRCSGCVLAEAEMQGINGLGLLAQLRARGIDIALFLLVNMATPEFTERALAAGARGVFEKPLVKNDIAQQLEPLFRDSWSGLGAARTHTEMLADGAEITVRTIQPDDRDIEQAFVHNLSPRSRYQRFFSGLKDLPDALLERFTHIHYPDHIAFIATVSEGGRDREIGVARYLQSAAGRAEFAVVVADAWQHRGVATLLFKHLLACAQRAGIRYIEGSVLRENRDMLNFARQFGFAAAADPDDARIVNLTLPLAATPTTPND